MTIRKGHVITLVSFDIPINNRQLVTSIKVEKRTVEKAGDKYFYITSSHGSARRFDQDSVGKIVAGIWLHKRSIVAVDHDSAQSAIALATKTLTELAKERIKEFNALALQHAEALQSGISVIEK